MLFSEEANPGAARAGNDCNQRSAPTGADEKVPDSGRSERKKMIAADERG